MRRAAIGGALAAVLVLAGCTEGDPDLPAPEPEGRDADLCRTLMDALPGSLLGEERREVEPDSEFVTGWGDPAVILRCGVDRPAELKPASELLVVNDIAWLGVPADDPTTFTAVGRGVYVELTVPASYEALPAESLPDVSDSIEKNVPALPDGEL